MLTIREKVASRLYSDKPEALREAGSAIQDSYSYMAGRAIAATIQALIEMDLPEKVSDVAWDSWPKVTTDWRAAVQDEFRAILRAIQSSLTETEGC